MNQRNNNRRQHHREQTPASSRIQMLDERCFTISIEMSKLRVSEKALRNKWQLWHQQRADLDSEISQTFAQSIISAFGGPNLVPDAQDWHYRNNNLKRVKNKLELRGIEIQAALSAYDAELYLIYLEIDMLINFP